MSNARTHLINVAPRLFFETKLSIRTNRVKFTADSSNVDALDLLLIMAYFGNW